MESLGWTERAVKPPVGAAVPTTLRRWWGWQNGTLMVQASAVHPGATEMPRRRGAGYIRNTGRVI